MVLAAGSEWVVECFRLGKVGAFAVVARAFDDVYVVGICMVTFVQDGSASCCNCSLESLYSQRYPPA